MNKVEKVPICDPIQAAIEKLTSLGAQVVKSEVGDYHFHELRFEIKDIENEDFLDTVNEIDKLNLKEKKLCACSCHWSTIKLA